MKLCPTKPTVSHAIVMVALLLTNVLAGCGGGLIHKDDAVAPLTPEAKKTKIKIDKKLLTKCPTFHVGLGTGEDGEVVAWSQLLTDSQFDCRKAQWGLVDWVNKTFELE